MKRGHRVSSSAARPASKAAAIADMRAETGARRVIFVGDDLTDEDVFAALGPATSACTSAPDPPPPSAASRDPAAVHHLLRPPARVAVTTASRQDGRIDLGSLATTRS